MVAEKHAKEKKCHSPDLKYLRTREVCKRTNLGLGNGPNDSCTTFQRFVVQLTNRTPLGGEGGLT